MIIWMPQALVHLSSQYIWTTITSATDKEASQGPGHETEDSDYTFSGCPG